MERHLEILRILKELYPEVKSALNFSNPFELLIATILSAQCKDDTVNVVTKELFNKLKTPKDYIDIPLDELEKMIYKTGFYKQKAKSIKNCCQYIINNYNGEVPADFDKLTKLPGVGRKTASVVAGNAFNIPSIAVDTHVKRLSNLLKLTKSQNPDIIEFDLKKLYPENEWINLSHYLIYHGRNICIARKPKCELCKISHLCPSIKL
jgi:endonuclease-3